MHKRQSHGGYAVQAARRDEEYELCNECGQRRHGRLKVYPMVDLVEEEAPSPWRIFGLVVFCLFMFLAVAYAGPIVLAGLSGV